MDFPMALGADVIVRPKREGKIKIDSGTQRKHFENVELLKKLHSDRGGPN